MKHYLYGFTIYSIQSYIFQTNKLKEIAGASELVEQICTTKFAKMLGKTADDLKSDPFAIRNAAGNIRYIFTDETKCKNVVRNFPKIILEFAPGVQIGQAIVSIDDVPTKKTFSTLETLLTDQRNNPIRPVDLGYIAINRSRRTGLPSVERIKYLDEILINDRATKQKQDIIDGYKKNINKCNRVNLSFFGTGVQDEKIPIDVEKIVSSKSREYSWLAVIHADGNNMGQALQNLGEEINSKEDYSIISKKFSEAVDLSTKTAAQNAFYETMPKEEIDKTDYVPFRPVIVGGDDLTIVCRADLALVFTNNYLREFEVQTKKNFSESELTSLAEGLTACAGIAFIKVNYPFHYAIDLAEELCAHAKKDAKSKLEPNILTPSCLMFHKVQDSFVERFEDIIERELTAKAVNCKFDFGPYYLESKINKPLIKDLLNNVAQLKDKEGNAIKSSLRQWLTDLHNNEGVAIQRMNRLLSHGNENNLKKLKLNVTKGFLNEKSPVYDWLTILSINQNNDYNENDD